MPVDLKVPSAGESVTEVQIGQWRKAVGDFVNADEIIVEIETDKATMELPAPAAGVLTTIGKPAGSAAKVGDIIGQIDDTARAPASAKGAQSTPAAKAAAAPAAKSAPPATAAATATAVAEPHVMPAARRMLAEHGLQPAQVAASGPGGRLLKEDVQRHIEQPAAPREADGHAARAAPAHAGGPREEETVPMTMLRRRIAERLVEAQHTAAMLTTFNEIDMTAVMHLRKERAEAFEKRYGVKLGFMSFFVKAAVDALRTIPQVNAEIRNMPAADGRSIPHIVYHNYCDVGVAVSTEQGLVVPVIRNAERLSFAEIELTIGELANRARARKLTLDELQGGTFTISNGGVFGSLMSTPILNPPQSGILGLHAIQDRPVARDGQIVIRPMMYVALSYDHRIVDGRESVTFLKRIKECVEDPTRMLLEI